VTPHEYWLSLGSSDAERRKAYLALFEEPLTDADLAAIRKASHEGTALGDRASCRRLEQRLGVRVTPGARGRPRKKMV
jgi:putative transposase